MHQAVNFRTDALDSRLFGSGSVSGLADDSSISKAGHSVSLTGNRVIDRLQGQAFPVWFEIMQVWAEFP
jgi:hypothetical protein